MRKLLVASMASFLILAGCAEEEMPDSQGGACEGDCGDLFVACFQSGEVLPFDIEEMTRGEGAVDGIAGPQAIAAYGEDYLLVVGALDGSFTVIDREKMETVGRIILKDSRMLDSVLVRGERAIVIASGTNEVVTLDLRDPTKPKIESSVSTGEGSNPMSAAFDEDGVLWVSLYFSNQLLPIADGVAGEPVELPKAEGQPLPTGVAVAGAKAYVSLNNLNEEWAPAGNGRLVAVALASKESQLIDLGSDCTNAGHIVTDGSRIFVPCGGRFMEEDGAVAAYDIASGTVQTIATGGSPARLSLHPTKPGVVYAADSGSADLIVVDFEEKTAERHEVCAEAEWEFVADVLAAN